MKHIKPTTEEKLSIFQRALAYVINNGYANCICLAVREAQKDLRFIDDYGFALWTTKEEYSDDGGNNMKNNFPELLKRKPKDKSHSEAWWTYSKRKPTKKRLDAINSIIAELEAEIILTTEPNKL